MDRIEVDLRPQVQRAEFVARQKRTLSPAQFKAWQSNYEKADYDCTPRFAWVKVDGTLAKPVMHTPTYECRDHICDWLNYPKQKSKERGELLSAGHIEPVPTDATRLLITFESNLRADEFVNNFEFIHQKEEEFFSQVPKSKLFEVDGSTSKRMFYIEADSIFSKSSVTNSFYTLMLRLTPYLKGKRPTLNQLADGATGRADEDYLSDARDAVKDLDKYVGALKDIDFSVTHMPYGGATDVQYCHSVGGFQWMAEYLARATTDPRYVNLYGNQIVEQVLGNKPHRYRGKQDVSTDSNTAKKQYLYGEENPGPWR